MTREEVEGRRRWEPDATILDGLPLASMAIDLDGVVVYANESAEQLFAPPGSAGPRSLLGVDARARLFDDPRRGTAFGSILESMLHIGSWGGELTAFIGGQRTTISTTWSVVRFAGAPVGALVMLETVSGSETTLPISAAGSLHAGRLQNLAAVFNELLTAGSVEAVAKVVTDQLTDAAGATIGSLVLLVDDETLALVAVRGAPEGVASRWATFPLTSDNPSAEAARTVQPVIVVGAEEIALRYPDHNVPVEGDRSVVCFPLVAGGRCLGTLGLSFPGRWSGDQAETLFLRLMADTCALTLDRLDAQQAAADREAKLIFLAETSARLASDLDYEATLRAVAEAAIPWFADWCTVAIADDGVLRSIAVAHAQPQHEELVQQLQERYPPRPEDGSYEVLRTGESVLVPELTDDLLRAGARDEEHYQMTARLGLRSALACALKAGTRTFGVITWISGDGGRRFSAADQIFAETLAQRAGTAIDNAQLHSQVRDVALRLQHAVLPSELPSPPGWTSAVCYLPAGRTDVGGDFYDVVPLIDGRMAIFVGDVMGRGVEAASVMAQMRSAIRTLLAVDPSPAAVLAGMDRVFDALQLEHLVTMIYALADPGADRLDVINAGHPSPLVIRSEGSIEVIDPGSAIMLGIGGGDRPIHTIEFAPGDALLLYTDGLVERRGEDLDEGMTRLVAALDSPENGDPEAWLTRLVDQIRDPTRDDDVAALLLRRDPVLSGASALDGRAQVGPGG